MGLGAAWQKTARDTERDYLSVKLDDPSFSAPIHASLIEVEGQARRRGKTFDPKLCIQNR
ncbi:uncharacterized protein (DUF736 family) [Bradyrhizobium huanghuaihaiense]|uniref:DUF736 family protein n=1 Tax=Bradyrhizobium barranii subsp. barranii TaxID=2823807 RepID=A0A7Z0QLJ9_9BRAD|nr:DUF736 family protein [Bradyrhizobium barranii]